jgi:hypothetical protein
MTSVSASLYGRTNVGLYNVKNIKFRLLKTIKLDVFMLYVVDIHPVEG